MNLDRVTAGIDVPNDFNVIIEIPMNADPIKYEVDKVTGAVFVDRFMPRERGAREDSEAGVFVNILHSAGAVSVSVAVAFIF